MPVKQRVLLLGSGFTVAPCVEYLTRDKSVAVTIGEYCVLLLGCTVAPYVEYLTRGKSGKSVAALWLLLFGSGFTVAPCVEYLTRDKRVAVLCSVT